MFNPRSTRSPTPAGLPLGYFCMNVQSALHAEPDVEGELGKLAGINVQSALHAEPDSKNSQSLVCLYSFITAYFTGFCKHPTHTKRL